MTNTTTIAATDLAEGHRLTGPQSGCIVLTAAIILDNPFEPDGYVEALLATPPTPQGATRRWTHWALDDFIHIAA